LVTGPTGFLGTNAGLFLADKVEAVGLGRQTSSSQYPRFIQADLRDHARVAQAVEELAPTVVLHTAALSSHEGCEREPELARELNVAASRTLAESASRVGAKFIYISTDAVFDGQRGMYSEQDSPNPFSVYGQTKLEGEHAVGECLDALILRTNFFGWSPTGTRSILEFFLSALESSRSVAGYTDFVVTSIYVQSLLEGIWALNEADTRGLVHLASRDAASKYQFGIWVAREFGLDASVIHPSHSSDEVLTTSRSRDISLDVTRFETLVGKPAPSQVDGLMRARADRVWHPSLMHPDGQRA
jgi:dTDP-4-dehydrorhamnose reductase